MADLRYKDWDDPKRESVLAKRNSQIRRRRMKAYRSVPVCRRVWFVTLTATAADLDTFSPHDLPAGLTFTPQEFWCLSRRAAKRLILLDQAAGGSGTMYAVEYRLCPNCGRILLGPAAREYREKQFKPTWMWHYPDGPACNLECKPNGRGDAGQRLTYQTERIRLRP